MYGYFKDFHEPGISDSGLFLHKEASSAMEVEDVLRAQNNTRATNERNKRNERTRAIAENELAIATIENELMRIAEDERSECMRKFAENELACAIIESELARIAEDKRNERARTITTNEVARTASEELYPLAHPDVQQQQAAVEEDEEEETEAVATTQTWVQRIMQHMWFLIHTVFEMTDVYIHGMHEGMSMNDAHDEGGEVHEE